MNELLRKLRVQVNHFKPIDQTPEFGPHPPNTGWATGAGSGCYRQFSRRKPEPLVSSPCTVTLIDNMFILTLASAENGALSALSTPQRVLSSSCLDLIKDFSSAGTFALRHLHEADVGIPVSATVNPCCGSTKILIVRVCCSMRMTLPASCLALKPFDDGASKTLLCLNPALKQVLRKRRFGCTVFDAASDTSSVLKIAIEDLLAAAFKDCLLVLVRDRGLFDDFSALNALMVDDSLAIRRRILYIEDDFGHGDAGPVGTEEGG